MKLRKKLVLVLGIIYSIYSFAGNDWYVSINNKTDKPVSISLYKEDGCFHVEDFVPKTIPAGTQDYVYLQENSNLSSKCAQKNANKFVTLLLDGRLDQSVELNSQYNIDNPNKESFRQVKHSYYGEWFKICSNTISREGDRIDVYFNFNKDGTIGLTNYKDSSGCSTR